MTSTSSHRNRSTARSRGKRRGPQRPAPPPELRESGLAARKALGQHFLTDERTLQRTAEAAEIAPDETVIEIGAGLGALTAELSERSSRVIAVELDDGLAAYLEGRFAGTNVTVVHGNALELTPDELLGRAGATPPYVMTGNLPYNIAQPLLRRVLETRPPPRRLIVMVQAEVADSIAAQRGSMSLLSVSIQLYGEPRLLFRVPPSAFYPPPKVRSAVVRIDVAPELRAPVDDIEAFFHIARTGFRSKRKQLHNALVANLRIEGDAASELLAAAGIDGTLRAQALTLDQWAALSRAWVERGRPGGAA